MSSRVVVVTGSTAGIGAAVATAFARDGATVWVNGRHPERTTLAAERIGTTAGSGVVRPIAADVAAADGADELLRAVPDADILINNASHYGPAQFDEISDDLWRGYFEANVLSGIRLTRRYLPGMVARGWGRVVFVSSESADLYGEDTPAEEMERRFFAEARPTSLLKRFAHVDEVANMVHYIGSDHASATTGAALRVDGGLIGSIIP